MKWIPTDFKFKIKGFFYSLLIFAVCSSMLYSQRGNLTSWIISILNPSFLWGLIENWQLNEWLPHFFYGPLSLFIAATYYSLRSSLHRREAPEQLSKAMKLAEIVAQNCKAVNENIFNFFKFFEPVFNEAGLTIRMNEVGLISLRQEKSDHEERERTEAAEAKEKEKKREKLAEKLQKKKEELEKLENEIKTNDESS